VPHPRRSASLPMVRNPATLRNHRCPGVITVTSAGASIPKEP
jgi:hypothetical protein